jgi:hypothetical protein
MNSASARTKVNTKSTINVQKSEANVRKIKWKIRAHLCKTALCLWKTGKGGRCGARLLCIITKKCVRHRGTIPVFASPGISRKRYREKSGGFQTGMYKKYIKQARFTQK